ncbi:MAG: cell division protein ZapE [Pseudomonadota bacterium]
MTLQQRYEQSLLGGAHVADPHQQVVVNRLDTLGHCLASQPMPGAVRRWLQRLRREIRYPATCRGIYIWGPVGRGKTWLMDLFHAGMPRHHARRMHFAHFMREIHMRRRTLHGQERPLDRIAALLAKSARVYCIDEFMVQDIGDAMILHGVLNGLLRRGVVLVMTSNTEPARLYEGGLQRERFLPAIALLSRELDVVQVGAGVDYRRQQLQAAPTYLPANDSRSTTHMAALFQTLAGTAEMERAARMIIEDRPIETLRHAGRMAWFGFSALCEGPRSADDYIAIARNLHTVFLSDVPVFDGSNDDPARRFIALIDELYDQHVQLVISAAAEPTELYRGERLRHAFERTSSRLIEMRSTAYLAHERQPAAPLPGDQ